METTENTHSNYPHREPRLLRRHEMGVPKPHPSHEPPDFLKGVPRDELHHNRGGTQVLVLGATSVSGLLKEALFGVLLFLISKFSILKYIDSTGFVPLNAMSFPPDFPFLASRVELPAFGPWRGAVRAPERCRNLGGWTYSLAPGLACAPGARPPRPHSPPKCPLQPDTAARPAFAPVLTQRVSIRTARSSRVVPVSRPLIRFGAGSATRRSLRNPPGSPRPARTRSGERSPALPGTSGVWRGYFRGRVRRARSLQAVETAVGPGANPRE